jgi:tetratricopeptide (TPR) repeat protein
MSNHFERGLRLFEHHWYAAALWEWGQHLPAARRHPADLARTFNAMATCLLEQGEAQQAYVKAELARDAASQLASDHPQAFYAHLNGAIAAYRCGDLETSRALAERALRLDSPGVPAWRLAQVMIVMAAIAGESEQHEAQRAWAERTCDIDTEANHNVWPLRAVHLAIATAALDMHDDAEEYFEEAIAGADPEELANIYAERGWARLRRGDAVRAWQDATAALDALAAYPAFIEPLNVGDCLMLLSALCRSCGEREEAARLYTLGFTWMAAAGRRAHLRRSTRAALDMPVRGADSHLPDWPGLAALATWLLRGEHRGPAAEQRLGRAVFDVSRHFRTRTQPDVLSAATVYWLVPEPARRPASLPVRSLSRQLERASATRRSYDLQVVHLLCAYDRGVNEEARPYPEVLEDLATAVDATWDQQAVRQLVLAHAS